MVIQSLNGSEFYFSFSLHCFESGHTDGIRPKEAELVRSKQMLNPPPGDRPRPPAEGHSFGPAGADPRSDHIAPSWDPLRHTDHSPVKPEGCCIHRQITKPSPDLSYPVPGFVFSLCL